MSEGTNFKHCKGCGVLQERIYIGKFEDGKNNKYVNKDNKLWNGRVCPTCHKKDAKRNMSIIREIRKVLKSE